MVERAIINVKDVKPSTVRPFEGRRLRQLEPVFRDAAVCGSSVLEEVPPVILIKDPKSGERLLYDGNHRLTLATIYGISMFPALIAEVGDTLVLEGFEHKIEPYEVSLCREFGEKAKQAGYDSFDAFAKFASGKK